MNSNKSVFKLNLLRRTFAVILSTALLLSPFAGPVAAQTNGVVETGVAIPVRTLEDIRVNRSDGRIFAGAVDRHVRNRRGDIALPQGTMVELVVRQIGEDLYVLDLESALVNGQYLTVNAEDTAAIEADDREGIGANSRTSRYVGVGALAGAIIGALAGGGKGAAIGGGAGAAAGVGALATRGRNVVVPAESLITFRLERPLRVSNSDRRFNRNGVMYRPGYGLSEGDTVAFDSGLRAGRADRERSRAFNARTDSWRGQDALEYREGYERGYAETPRVVRNNSNIQIGADRWVRWSGPANARVYVQTDNNPRQLFSGNPSGVAPAPWISYGHRYVFTLVDRNGREIARDVNDLRRSPRTSN